ncbi:longitudinals lacking protein, isoforms N/O/W/X/Y-like [Condylostylus longicornis]|uniref:longitudinals lacking protein, isoforms N/O/W/X/Y-like n=1 Tax=Condylostylus longicornis TaxID=2530218 RepID=UPI00244D9D07|nr:longitudinals lacking protein, isoforms N/O/W/X/Y-like [Condylostylus longicornis]
MKTTVTIKSTVANITISIMMKVVKCNSIWTLVEALPTSTAIVTPQATHTVLLQIPASVAASAGLQNNIQLQTLIPAVTAATTGTTLTTQSIKHDKDIKTNYTVQEIHTIEAIEEISSHQLHELQTHEQQHLQQQHRQSQQPQNDHLQLPQQHIKSHTATASTTTQLADDDGLYEDIPHLEQESIMSDEYNKETIKTVQISSHQHQKQQHQPHKSITTKGKIVITNPKASTVKQFKIPTTPLQIQHQKHSLQQSPQTQQQQHQPQSQQFSTNQKLKYEKSDIKPNTKEITITSISGGVKMKSELPFVCDQCGKPYKIKGSLKRHKIYECGVVPSLQCNYCTHRSKYKSDLKKHVLQKHPDVYEGID